MTSAGRKVLVTGAGGFIGRHLVRDQLSRGRRVVAIDIANLEHLVPHDNLIRSQVDIRNLGAFRGLLDGCDTVFHLAAAHLDVLMDEAAYYEVNVAATGELVQSAAEAGVSRFVHCSSAGVFGPQASLPINEETGPTPQIPYENSKLAGEQAVRKVSAATGIDAIILRPAWVYGPYCPRTFKLIRSVSRRRFFYVGGCENLRHPVFIDDVVESFELAAASVTASAETAIVAGPDTVTIRQLIGIIIDELGIAIAPITVPLGIMRPVCAAVESIAGLAGREPPFSRRSLKFFTDSAAFETGKARRLLGFDASVNTREGIRRTIGHYRQQGLL